MKKISKILNFQVIPSKIFIFQVIMSKNIEEMKVIMWKNWKIEGDHE
jgi:hypothetical protein